MHKELQLGIRGLGGYDYDYFGVLESDELYEWLFSLCPETE